MFRKLIKYLGGFLLVALLLLMLVVISPGFTQPVTEPIRAVLVQVTTKVISKSLKGSLEIGELSGSLLKDPRVRDVRLKDVQGNIVAQFDALKLRYDVWQLLKGRLRVRAIELVAPRLSLVQGADGQTNLSKIFSQETTPVEPEETSAGTGLPLAISLERVELQDGHLHMELPGWAGTRDISDLSLRLQGELDAQGLRLELQQLVAHASPSDVSLELFQGRLSMEDGRLALEDWKLHTKSSRISLNAVIPGSTQAVNGELQLQPLDVAEIGKLLGDEALHGVLRSSVKVQGPPEAIEITGNLSTDEGTVAIDGQVDSVSAPARYRGTLSIKALNLASLIDKPAFQSDLNLNMQLQGQGLTPADLAGDLSLILERSHLGEITIKPSKIQVNAETQRFQVQTFLLNTSVLSVQANGDLDLGGHSKLDYRLESDLDDLQQLLSEERLSGKVKLNGKLSGEWPNLMTEGSLTGSAIVYQENRLTALDLTYDATQLGTEPDVKANLDVRSIRAGTMDVESLAANAAYEGRFRRLRLKSTIRQSSRVDASLNANVAFGDQLQTLDLNSFKVRFDDHSWKVEKPTTLTFGADRFELSPLRLVHADEAIELSGGIQGQQLQDLRLQATQLDLDFIKRFMQLPPAVGGRADAHAKLEGSLSAPVIDAGLSLLSTAATKPLYERAHLNVGYAEHQLKSTISVHQNGRDVVDTILDLPVRLDLVSMPLTQRLIEKPLTMRLQIDRPDLSHLHTGLPNIPRLSGTLSSTLNLVGTYNSLLLDTSMELEGLGIAGIIEKIQAPLKLSGNIALASSESAVSEALSQGKINLAAREISLNVPSLQAQLPDENAAKPLLVQDLKLSADADWNLDGLKGSLHEFHVVSKFANLPRTKLTLAAAFDPNQLTVKRIQIKTPESELQANGRYGLRDEQLQFDVDIPRLALKELAGSLPAQLPPSVNGKLALSGSRKAPNLDAGINYAGARIDAKANADLNAKQPSYRANLKVANLEIGRFARDLQGRFTATFGLEGRGFTEQQREAELALEIDSKDFTLAPELKASVLSQLVGSTLNVEHLRIHSVPMKLAAKGTVSAQQKNNLSYKLTIGDLTPLEKFLGVPIKAKGDWSGELDGEFKNLRAQNRLEIKDWQYADWKGKKLRTVLDIKDLGSAPTATVEAELLGLEGPQLSRSALRLDARYRDTRGDFLFAVTKGPFVETKLEGRLEKHQDLQIGVDTLQLKRDAWAWRNAEPIRVVYGDEGALAIKSFKLENGEQRINLQGRVSPERLDAIALSVEKLEIKPTIQAFLPTVDVPDGALSANVSADGRLQQPRVAGSLQLGPLQWQGQSLGHVKAELESTDSVARTDVRWIDQKQELLLLDGELSLKDTNTMNLKLRVPDLDLARLQPFSREILNSAGRLNVDLQATGTLSRPQVLGKVELRDGELRLAATRETYKDIQGRLVFNGKRMEIEQFQMLSGGGRATLAGWLETAERGVGQMDLRLNANDFQVMNTSAIKAVISSNVSARGTLEDTLVAGKIKVLQARIRHDNLPASGQAPVEPWELTVDGVFGSGVQEGPTPKDKPKVSRRREPLGFLRADLQLDIPRNVWIQGRGTAIEMGGKLDIKKKLRSPFVLGGDLRAIRGFATVFTKRFTIKRGEIVFTGAREINPYLDIEAAHGVSDYTVYVLVTGRSKKPEIEFRSEPPLEQDDIVSLLVFGRTQDQLTNSEGSALESRAADVGGKVAAGMLQQSVGQAFGFDTVDIDFGSETRASRVGVGRYISQDVFLSYEQIIRDPTKGNRSGSRVGVEYRINRKLSVEVSSSDIGESAVDLNWGYDY